MCFIPSRPWSGASGSTEMQRIAGSFSRRYRVMPTNVPDGAEARDEVGDAAAGLRPDLRARRLEVRPPVGVVGVLVRVEVEVRAAAPPAARARRMRAVGPLQRIGPLELRAVGAPGRLRSARRVGGKADEHRAPESAADHRAGDARVPRGRLQDRLARRSRPCARPSTSMARAARSLTLPAGVRGARPWRRARRAADVRQFAAGVAGGSARLRRTAPAGWVAGPRRSLPPTSETPSPSGQVKRKRPGVSPRAFVCRPIFLGGS